MNVYPFASGGRAAARRYSKDEAGGNDPTWDVEFSNPNSAPAKNEIICRNPRRPFVLWTQSAEPNTSLAS